MSRARRLDESSGSSWRWWVVLMEYELILGDARYEVPKIAAMEEKMVMVTDPPFNIGYHYNSYSDNMPEEQYYEMLEGIFWHSPFVVIHYPEEIYKIAFQVGQFPERVVSWVYNSNTAKQHRDIAFFGVKPDFTKCGQPYKNPKDKRIQKRIAEGKSARLYDWWEVNQVKNVSNEKTEHPCQMPLEVMMRIVAILPDDVTIVDPFMGSGTTGVACQRLGKRFIGIESDAKYYEIAQRRMSESF
jgi:DNA modification methylase